VIGLKLSKQRGDVKAAPLPRALFWDTKDDYHYVRYARDGHDDVLVVGGEDVKTAHADDQPARFDALERWANERLGISGERAYAWSGQVRERANVML
jgi:glycine/D-amino acid oxidase-like deaminating enzyme